MPRLYELYPGIYLTLEEKAGKNLSQGTDKSIKLIKCTGSIGFYFDKEIAWILPGKFGSSALK